MSTDPLRQEVEDVRLDEMMRDGMRELARQGDPLLCQCWSYADGNMVLHVEYCPAHKIEASAARIAFGPVTYERAFERECDALDRQHIVLHMIRREDVRAQVVKVGRFWLLLSSYGRIKLKTDEWPV